MFINGTTVKFEAYYIGGSNYFKLRDLALALKWTEKQFNVGYDETTKAITLTSGVAYEMIGGEMSAGDGLAKPAVLNESINISKDGAPVTVTAYLIGGNNFVKLRDVMEMFDIYVGYDPATRDITIDTSEPYTAQ